MTAAKGFVPFAALALVGAALAFWLFAWRTPPSPLEPDPTRPGSAPESRRSDPGPLRSETRPVGEPAQPHGSARVLPIRIRDAETGAPVANARLCHPRDGRVLATSRADGGVELPGDAAPEFLVACSGYLLRLGRPEEASANGTPLELTLQPDRFTIPFVFAFVTAAGRPARQVAFVVTCKDVPPPLGGSLPRTFLRAGETATPALQQAWQEHQLLASAARFAAIVEERGHFGVQSDTVTFVGDERATLRFCAPGRYAIAARTELGELAELEFAVAPGQTSPFEVRLSAGTFLEGVVVSSDGTPVAEATLADVSEGRGHALPLVIGTTDAAGHFHCGPLPRVAFPLAVTHDEHEAARVDAVLPGSAALRIVLAKRASRVVAGSVRSRPKLEALPGARVRLEDPGRRLRASTQSDASGAFRLTSAASELVLVIEAPGHLAYREIVDGDLSHLVCDLLPDTAERRTELGLSALVSGRLLDARGEPLGGVPVLLVPGAPVARVGTPGRRVLSGGVLELPLRATTEPDGSFRIECDVVGEARLVPAGSRPEDGIPVTISLGTRTSDHLLRLPR